MEQHNFLGIMHSIVTKGTLDTSTSKELRSLFEEVGSISLSWVNAWGAGCEAERFLTLDKNELNKSIEVFCN